MKAKNNYCICNKKLNKWINNKVIKLFKINFHKKLKFKKISN